MTAHTDIKTVHYGVNVEALLGAREAIEATPDAGQFTWRANCKWVDGVDSRSTIDGFFGLGEEQARKSAHSISADHPEQFAAMDMGPSPVEIVLAGLAMNHALSGHGIDHLILDRGNAGNAWRTKRRDSLRLLTPN